MRFVWKTKTKQNKTKTPLCFVSQEASWFFCFVSHWWWQVCFQVQDMCRDTILKCYWCCVAKGTLSQCCIWLYKDNRLSWSKIFVSSLFFYRYSALIISQHWFQKILPLKFLILFKKNPKKHVTFIVKFSCHPFSWTFCSLIILKSV